MTAIRALLLYSASTENRTLSYQRGWPRQFAAHPAFNVTAINVADRRHVAKLKVLLFAGRPRFDVIVVLHSIFSNSPKLTHDLTQRLGSLSAAKVFFIGNEYKLMPEKMAFCDELNLDLLVSQISSPAALDLYRERLRCVVVGIPNTGLDPALFAPRLRNSERPLEIGYRAFASPVYLGHDERSELVREVGAAAARRGITVDITLDPSARFDEVGWAAFLNRCRCQLGSEAGGDYFELTDATRTAVNAYLAANPEATIAQVRREFFDDYVNPVSGRALSSRIVEAAGTKTVQILLDGEYGGYFREGEHFIALRKDFSNVDEALEQLRDEELCRGVAENAYQVAIEELTYPKLIDRFRSALDEVV